MSASRAATIRDSTAACTIIAPAIIAERSASSNGPCRPPLRGSCFFGQVFARQARRRMSFATFAPEFCFEKQHEAWMPLIPFGEYRPDVTDYDQVSTGAVLNALPRGDGYGPMPALSAYSAALPGPCRGFFKAIKTDGSVAIFAATSTKLYQLNNTNQTWTDVSKGAGSYSSVSSTDQWQFVQYINYVIAVQANAAPQFFDLTGATAFADLGGSPPQARYAAVVGSFVVLSGLVNNPYRVQWSALGDPTGWIAGVNSSSFQDLPDGGI